MTQQIRKNKIEILKIIIIKIKTNRWWEGESSRWWSRKTLSSPPPMITSKLQLHIDKLSLREIQRLAEQLFYKQGCKERTTQSLVGGEEKVSAPLVVTQKRRGMSQAWGSSLERKGFEPHIRHPSPGVWHQEDKSSWLLGKSLGLTRGL